MGLIDDIFISFNDSDLYQFLDEVRDEYDTFEEKLKEKLPEAYRDISDACSSYGAECERQGFINGFRYASLLGHECIGWSYKK